MRCQLHSLTRLPQPTGGLRTKRRREAITGNIKHGNFQRGCGCCCMEEEEDAMRATGRQRDRDRAPRLE